MQIESANVNDAQEILTIQKQAFLNQAKIYNIYTLPPLLETLDEVKAAFKTHAILKATQDGKIIGSVRFVEKDGTCFVGRLLVDPAFQNQGVGAELLRQVECHSPTVKRFELFTGFKSEKSLHLYKKLGYKEFKTGKDKDDITLIYLEKLK
ncbi:MAG: GNAT family N-acetyltransferase [Candidatus Bathyarchaeia archaeon]|jgi:RimJ/RimL family protein N-acetyltransferase